jgi:UDP-glucose 4-epimerase
VKKVAITGASGFLGTYIINMNVTFNIVELDLLCLSVAEINFSEFDAVLHLAALVHQMKGADDTLYTKINRDLAFDVAKKAKSHGVKHFILMSTAKVFDESNRPDALLNENTVCNPSDSYGKSKYEAENLVASLNDKTFKVAIIRSPLVYGAGVKGNMLNLLKLVDKFSLLPFGGIENRRTLVYIANLAALIEQIIKKEVSGIFIAGDRFPLSTTDLVTKIGSKMRKKMFLFKIPRMLLKIFCKIKPALYTRLFGSFVLNTSQTNARLEFVPPFSTDDGISEMVDWYDSIKNNGLY